MLHSCAFARMIQLDRVCVKHCLSISSWHKQPNDLRDVHRRMMKLSCAVPTLVQDVKLSRSGQVQIILQTPSL